MGREIMKSGARLVLSAVASLVATPVLAHPAIGAAHTAMAGLAHPFSGGDHLIAMLAVGLWAAMRGGRAVWMWPLSFLTAMVVGGALGALATTPSPAVEPMIMASVLVLGLALANAMRASLATGAVLIAVFGLAHGAAHGLEFARADGFVGYAIGFTASTAALHLLGLVAGLGLARSRHAQLARWFGGGAVVWGLAALLAPAL